MSRLFQGDCRGVLRDLPGNSVDAIVTDPPYGLEFMGKDWDAPWKTDRRQNFDGTLQDQRENPYSRSKVRNGTGASYGADARIMQEFQRWCESWLAECLRVLKPGGYLLAFGGARTYHRLACAVEDAGFEIRDQIMWVYSSGFPKSLDVSKAIDKAAGAERPVLGKNENGSGPHKIKLDNHGKGDTTARLWSGWGTALKPAHEPIVVARKPIEGTVAANVLKWGTGAVNIDGCRIELSGGYKAKANGRPSLTKLGDKYDPENANQPDTLGRWPANLIHDGSEEVLVCFPNAPGQLADASSNSDARKTQNCYGVMKRGSHEPSHDSDNNGMVGFKMKPGARRLDNGSAARFFYCAKASKSDRGVGNTHPTVKPQALMRYLCRLVTPPGGVVLDPFLGSGTTGVACAELGYDFIGIEREAESLAFAKQRIEAKENEYSATLAELLA